MKGRGAQRETRREKSKKPLPDIFVKMTFKFLDNQGPCVGGGGRIKFLGRNSSFSDELDDGIG